MKIKLVLKTSSFILASLGLITIAPSSSQANVLGFYQTVFNTDWTQVGYGGMRGLGTGSVNLTGVTGTVTRSYLYWHGPTNSSDANINASVTFNGTPITGTNIGFSDDNFWGFDNSQAYRADVTSLVSGNGLYSLANFNKSSAEINGVSLLAFFDDGDSSNNRDVVLYEGNDANFANQFDPAGWDATLSGINYSSGTASLVAGVSDGQNFGASDDGDLRVNGTIIASGGIFQGNSVPNGPGGPNNGGLWDVRTFDITSSLSPGTNSLNVTLQAGVNDALSLISLAIDLPAGAAPPLPTSTPEPSLLLGLLTLGILGLGTTRKGKTH